MISVSDVANKAPPRYGKRREPTGPFSSKNEPVKKTTYQRNRGTNDKRPKPRGRYYGGAFGTENAGLTIKEEFGAEEPHELESVYTHGSKKKNINHLLNFSYGLQYDLQNERNQNYRVFSSPRNRRVQYSHKHKYNKEEFLQATYVIKIIMHISFLLSSSDF